MGHTTGRHTAPASHRRKSYESTHVTLTRREQDALYSAFAVILSPLDSIDANAWRGQVGTAIRELLGADRTAFQLDAPGIPLLYSEDYSQKTLDAYAGYYSGRDIGRMRRDELGLEVWNRALLHGGDLRAFWRSEIHKDFLVPNRILDSIGITVTLNGAANNATIFCHREKAGTPEFGERGVAILHLLLPAFKAGVRDLVRYSYQRESLSAHLDSLTVGIRVCDLYGKTVHQNPAFTKSLAGEAEVQKLERAVEEILQPLVSFSRERQGNASALAGRQLSLEVHTETANYEMRGSFLGRELFGAESRIAISLQRLAPYTALSDRALQERYGLTVRELEISRRLAQGQATKEVAHACGISLHTARRHTEKIFTKLDVRNRSQIGPKLRAG